MKHDARTTYLLENLTQMKFSPLGSFNNYVDRRLSFFDPPPICGEFSYPERGQKQMFLIPFRPHLVHVVIEWTPFSADCRYHIKGSIITITCTNKLETLLFASFFIRIKKWISSICAFYPEGLNVVIGQAYNTSGNKTKTLLKVNNSKLSSSVKKSCVKK